MSKWSAGVTWVGLEERGVKHGGRTAGSAPATWMRPWISYECRSLHVEPPDRPTAGFTVNRVNSLHLCCREAMLSDQAIWKYSHLLPGLRGERTTSDAVLGGVFRNETARPTPPQAYISLAALFRISFLVPDGTFQSSRPTRDMLSLLGSSEAVPQVAAVELHCRGSDGWWGPSPKVLVRGSCCKQCQPQNWESATTDGSRCPMSFQCLCPARHPFTGA